MRISIKKNLLLVGFVLLTYVQLVAAPGHNKGSLGHGEIKLGPQVAAGGFGVFGEYAINNSLGVQASLGYLVDFYGLESIVTGPYISKNALVKVSSINLPVVLRAYPGSDRQFCWLGGLRVGYVTNAEFYVDTKSAGEIFVERIANESKSQEMNIKDVAEQDKISRFQIGIVGGLDYEFKFGLMLGFVFVKNFTDVLEAKESYFNWNTRLSLGYNFGRFLK